MTFLLGIINSVLIVHVVIALVVITGVAFTFKVRRELWVRILVVVLLALAIGRNFTRYYAWAYGASVSGAFSMLGRTGFADTKQMNEWFASVEMAELETKAGAFPFCGGGYSKRIGDLKTGLNYLSTEVSRPSMERFRSPPSLKTLRLQISDPSDEGIAAAAMQLILDYRSGV